MSADYNQWRICCPHCGRRSTVRSSKQMCETVREAIVSCNNPDCMHSWVAQVVAVRTIAPSIKPNPKVYIPLSPRAPAANDLTGSQMELAMQHPPPRLATG